MPLYSLPGVYLGSDAEAKELYGLIKRIPKDHRDQFRSQNDFLKHCVLYTLEHDPLLKASIRTPRP